jgi:monoamine oxidase
MRKLVADAGLHLIRDRYAAGMIRWRRANDHTGRVIPHLNPADLLVLNRVLGPTRPSCDVRPGHSQIPTGRA